MWETNELLTSEDLDEESMRSSEDHEAILIEKFYLLLGTLVSPGAFLKLKAGANGGGFVPASQPGELLANAISHKKSENMSADL